MEGRDEAGRWHVGNMGEGRRHALGKPRVHYVGHSSTIMIGGEWVVRVLLLLLGHGGVMSLLLPACLLLISLPATTCPPPCCWPGHQLLCLLQPVPLPYCWC